MTVEATGWVPENTFGSRLLVVRRQLGLTVQEAAERCGLHYASWSGWENGRRPSDLAMVVKRVSDHLLVDRDWLMWGEAQPGPRPTRPSVDELRARRDSNPKPSDP
ncbi:helix-turn-helix domain-containing protein [Nocardioides sp.]|uniref:helix-turn-helix domain-containing protein n=1 Tax=Nocardioides sp. TaxID=35761 RepID=UPI0039E544F0